FQQRDQRKIEESQDSFLVTLATQIAPIHSNSQMNALFGQYRQTRNRALQASSGQEITQARKHVSLPLMQHLYEASTLDTASD
ncbi:phosphoenolpyruvate-protein phosphotransferase PtsP, partial [Klebsiella pneumoniae]|nr:phosphoenolpyruvate-protein phosphotransferase PtsP [Klebsiella pneumoniae]